MKDWGLYIRKQTGLWRWKVTAIWRVVTNEDMMRLGIVMCSVDGKREMRFKAENVVEAYLCRICLSF